CLSSSRKARFPVMAGKIFSSFAMTTGQVVSEQRNQTLIEVFDLDATPRAQALPRLIDPPQKPWIVFEAALGQGNFLDSGFPNCASHVSASDLATIATSTTGGQAFWPL